MATVHHIYYPPREFAAFYPCGAWTELQLRAAIKDAALDSHVRSAANLELQCREIREDMRPLAI